MNRDGKRAARERMLKERQRQETRDKRMRGLRIVGGVTAVVAIAAGTGVLMATHDEPDGPAKAVAVPAGFRNESGLPFGVTLFGPAGSDRRLLALSARLQRARVETVGALLERLD